MADSNSQLPKYMQKLFSALETVRDLPRDKSDRRRVIYGTVLRTFPAFCCFALFDSGKEILCQYLIFFRIILHLVH
jgi:hypothetical protein